MTRTSITNGQWLGAFCLAIGLAAAISWACVHLAGRKRCASMIGETMESDYDPLDCKKPHSLCHDHNDDDHHIHTDSGHREASLPPTTSRSPEGVARTERSESEDERLELPPLADQRWIRSTRLDES